MLLQMPIKSHIASNHLEIDCEKKRWKNCQNGSVEKKK